MTLASSPLAGARAPIMLGASSGVRQRSAIMLGASSGVRQRSAIVFGASSSVRKRAGNAIGAMAIVRRRAGNAIGSAAIGSGPARIALGVATIVFIVATSAVAAPVSLGMRPRPAAHGGFVDDMDCSACHTADGWQLAARAGASGFDHDRTGFALRGAHVQTGCARCHTGKARPAGACESCHRDPHQGRNDGSCAECHTAAAWSDTATLEQHRRTRMPLTGRHAVLDCTQCHRRTGERAFSDVPSDCYACHRAEFHAATIHPIHDGTGGSTPFSRDCGQCHRTTGWQPAIAPPTMMARSALRLADHDAKFTLTAGSHRSADCAACHPDARRIQLVRCDGCHSGPMLRTQHRMPIARATSACLSCHPRGAAR